MHTKVILHVNIGYEFINLFFFAKALYVTCKTYLQFSPEVQLFGMNIYFTKMPLDGECYKKFELTTSRIGYKSPKFGGFFY